MGGPGIEEALLAEGMQLQRCLLHGKRDFPYILYADGFKKAKNRLNLKRSWKLFLLSNLLTKLLQFLRELA